MRTLRKLHNKAGTCERTSTLKLVSERFTFTQQSKIHLDDVSEPGPRARTRSDVRGEFALFFTFGDTSGEPGKQRQSLRTLTGGQRHPGTLHGYFTLYVTAEESVECVSVSRAC